MMLSKFRNAIRDESGQGMTEYIIIVALIAIAAIGVITVFGDNVRNLFGASADALAGKETALETYEAGAKAEKKGLADFNVDHI
jgi:pilus assembly protein Flp/PilA